MNHRILTSMGGLVSALALLAPLPVAAQAPATTNVAAAASALARTPDGKPDLQGVWDFKTITPMERPRELGTKEFFTAEEAAAWEQQENRRQNRDLIDPRQGCCRNTRRRGRVSVGLGGGRQRRQQRKSAYQATH